MRATAERIVLLVAAVLVGCGDVDSTVARDDGSRHAVTAASSGEEAADAPQRRHVEPTAEDLADDSADDDVQLAEPRYNSDSPGVGANGTIGAISGGGAYGARRGGRRNHAASDEGKQTNNAVDLGLEWLHRHRSVHGHWDADGFAESCEAGTCGDPATALGDVGATAQALLAFFGAGETHNSGQYKDALKNGLRTLKQVQDADGCFGPREAPAFLHEHMWATLAMVEAYGLTGSRLWKDSAQRGVAFVRAAKNPYLGWGDGVRDGASNTTSTVLAVLVLRSAKMSELDVDETAFDDALRWLDRVTDPATGVAGHESMGDTDLERPYPHLSGDALSAAALLARVFAGQDPRRTEVMQRAADHLVARAESWESGGAPYDVDLLLFGQRAMHQVGGKHWKAWQDAMLPVIREQQARSDTADVNGSWNVPEADRAGGRVHATALGAMSLEVYYGHDRLFGGNR